MSVTFSPAIDPTVPVVFFIECADGLRREAWDGGPYAEAVERLEAHSFGCINEDCRDYGPSLVILTEEPEVNVSNTNARLLLEALGLPFGDGSGSLDAGDFLGRVLMALAVAPADPGVPSHQLVPGESTMFGPVSEFGATFIDCGRREGYLQERLVQLEEVARHAITAGRKVSWA